MFLIAPLLQLLPSTLWPPSVAQKQRCVVEDDCVLVDVTNPHFKLSAFSSHSALM